MASFNSTTQVRDKGAPLMHQNRKTQNTQKRDIAIYAKSRNGENAKSQRVIRNTQNHGSEFYK